MSDGRLYHDAEGRLYRDDGPAWESSMLRIWYRHGKRHRDGGPAYEWNNSLIREWMQDDKLHRDGGPAVERANGTKMWFRHGKPVGGPFGEEPR